MCSSRLLTYVSVGPSTLNSHKYIYLVFVLEGLRTRHCSNFSVVQMLPDAMHPEFVGMCSVHFCSVCSLLGSFHCSVVTRNLLHCLLHRFYPFTKSTCSFF